MVTFTLALGALAIALVWGAIEYWGQDNRRIAAMSAVAACVSAIAFIAAISFLHRTDNPWALMEMPMTCRYTLHGC
jgi:hypothetical protein